MKVIEEERDRRKATCPVCGEAVGPAPEICPECKTPHHWDCWQYSGGCAMYACPRKARKRKAVKSAGSSSPPKKIPFPRLVAGTWLGVFHVRWSTVVFAFFCEFAATFAYGIEAPGLSFMFLVGMFAAVFWAGVTSEVYNLDVVNGRISKSLLFWGREIAEWGVCPLINIEKLLVRGDDTSGGYKRQLSALLVDGSFLDLTPPYPANSEDELAVTNLLDRIREGTTIPIAGKTLPFDQLTALGKGPDLPETAAGAAARDPEKKVGESAASTTNNSPMAAADDDYELPPTTPAQLKKGRGKAQ